jgi:hypothetical protein
MLLSGRIAESLVLDGARIPKPQLSGSSTAYQTPMAPAGTLVEGTRRRWASAVGHLALSEGRARGNHGLEEI